MGADGELVSFPVFKTERAARVVAGGFDSHTLPPYFYSSINLDLTGFMALKHSRTAHVHRDGHGSLEDSSSRFAQILHITLFR